ncbi:phage holin family protein [Pseudochelatococcus lubricantis]|uniref:phage holin family protein n=1 Tax=Pseudochelatococcus lubricantis TaxID=1538102 RepID=UPI0035E68020
MIGLIRALLGAQMLAAQTARLREDARRAVSRIVGLAVAGILAVVAVGFLTAAGHQTLTRVLGPVSASLIVAGVYLALALIAWLATSLSARRPMPPAPAPAADLAAATQSAFQGLGETVRGLKPEELAQKGGQTLARTVGPLPLAGLAVLSGFLIARRVTRGK